MVALRAREREHKGQIVDVGASSTNFKQVVQGREECV